MRIRTLAVLVGMLVALAAPAVVRAQGLDWEFDRFDVTIEIDASGQLEVEERIIADFSRDPHRGIFRNIPYRYTRGGARFTVGLSDFSVSDEAGQKHPARITRKGGEVRIRIGDADVWRDEPVTYVIRYRVDRGVLFFDTHDELYWNPIPQDSQVPTERASCTVVLPEGVDPGSIRATSFVGVFGSSTNGPEAEIREDGVVRFEAGGTLSPGQGMTVAVGMPVGSVRRPTPSEKAMAFVAANGVLAAPFGVFGLLWLVVRRFGRDLGQPRPIVVQYSPPKGMTPLEAGTLVDEQLHMHDVSASLIDLAVRGHYRIEVHSEKDEPDPEDIELIKLSTPLDDTLKPFERVMLDHLFKEGDRVTLDDLRHKFYAALGTVKNEVHASLKRDGYVGVSLMNARCLWVIGALMGSVLVMVLAIAGTKGNPGAGWPWIVAGALVAVQLPFFAWFMPRKTVKGRRAVEHIKGLEEYIERAELEDLDAEARRHRFDHLLPYAMALGLTKEWAKKFDGLFDTPPDWYSAPGLSPGHFSTIALMSSLSHTSTSMEAAAITAPRTSGAGGGFGSGSSGFGGGGFSGGGGGGGSVGGW